MDGKRFDELSRRFATRQTRRSVLGLIGAAAAGLMTNETVGAALKKEKEPKNKPKKCYGEGSHCTNAKQCCSGICTNRQCAADVGTECTVGSDCAGFDSECQTRTCSNGTCGVDYAPYGSPVGDQIAGDCQANVCNGSGGVVTIAEDTDVPPAANDCISSKCTDGVPSTGPLPAGSSCATDGGVVCNGAGQCGACVPGEARDCYNGPAETEGMGICRAGTQTCRADGSGFDACAGEVLPRPEQCNGLDDDCDGSTDEGVPGVGGPCTTGLPGVCAQGILQCQSGALSCVPNVTPFSRPETCNGLDDDCDGVIDEGACPASQQCHLIRDTYRCCIPFGWNAGGDCSQCCAGRCRSFPFSTECAEVE